MTRKYLIRWLKLLPHRYQLSHHFLAAAAVTTTLGLIIFFLSLLPPSTHLSPSPSSRATPRMAGTPPQISARNYIILDPISQHILAQKAAGESIYPASTTKLLTALTVLDLFALEDTFVVTRGYPDGQDLGFTPGEWVTVSELLYAMLIQSANDAAEIFAEHYPGGRSAFVRAMNTKAVDLNLRATHFKNPTGLDEDGHLSTAADLARLAEAALANPVLSRIVASQNAVIMSPDSSQAHILTNTNELLGKVPGVLGIKTGFTDRAGQALISYVSRDNHPLIFVVLGSQDRAGDSASLIEWAYSSVSWP